MTLCQRWLSLEASWPVSEVTSTKAVKKLKSLQQIAEVENWIITQLSCCRRLFHKCEGFKLLSEAKPAGKSAALKDNTIVNAARITLNFDSFEKLSADRLQKIADKPV